jgi:hypothetical protein
MAAMVRRSSRTRLPKSAMSVATKMGPDAGDGLEPAIGRKHSASRSTAKILRSMARLVSVLADAAMSSLS